MKRIGSFGEKKGEKLPPSFYWDSDVVLLGKKLLGKFLFTEIKPKHLTGGMIVETESYAGISDRASHAYGGKRTKRVDAMYEKGGISYIYLCYGMHHLFNVVTNIEGIPHAILIRAIEPQVGIDIMLKRREKEKLSHTLTSGPGAMSRALGIHVDMNKTSLLGEKIWIEDRGVVIDEKRIIKSPRVGVSYAKEDADLPYRFRVKENPYTSKAK